MPINIFINDLNEMVKEMIIKFTNDMKLGVCGTLKEKEKIQKDL